MDSVKGWASSRSFAYRFVDDTFFDWVPGWFSEAVKNQRHLVSDLARLELARAYLEEGWDRVVWVDADMLIIEPDLFEIDPDVEFLLCRELWMTCRQDKIMFSSRVNNSILVFRKQNQFLSFYIEACKSIVLSKAPNLVYTEIGTRFLTGLPQFLPLVNGIGMLSPFLLEAFYRSEVATLRKYRERLSEPMRAANLCLTFRNTGYRDLILTDDVLLSVVDCLKSAGLK